MLWLRKLVLQLRNIQWTRGARRCVEGHGAASVCHLREFSLMLTCSSRAAIKALAAASPNGSLAYSSASKKYREIAVTDPSVTNDSATLLPCPRLTPLLIQAAPRQSGRYPAGVQRTGGKHVVGKKRSSGQSGTQFSGAHKRFNRLLLVPASTKKPAARRA